MNELTTINENRNKMITEYDSKYCVLLLDYAYCNFNITGFFGEYNILPSTSDEWEVLHEDWRNAIIMAEYKIQAGLNKSYGALLAYAIGKPSSKDPITGKPTAGRLPDFEMMQKILFKLSDVTLKIEKDTGKLKRRGMDDIKKQKQQSKTMNESDTNIANQIAEVLLKTIDDN